MEDVNIMCSMCKHYLSDLKCKAFPDGIPDKIIDGSIVHDKPLPDQENDIVFEPIEHQPE